MWAREGVVEAFLLLVVLAFLVAVPVALVLAIVSAVRLSRLSDSLDDLRRLVRHLEGQTSRTSQGPPAAVRPADPLGSPQPTPAPTVTQEAAPHTTDPEVTPLAHDAPLEPADDEARALAKPLPTEDSAPVAAAAPADLDDADDDPTADAPPVSIAARHGLAPAALMVTPPVDPQLPAAPAVEQPAEGTALPSRGLDNLEELLGRRLLTWLGIAILFLAAAFVVHLAYEHGYLGRIFTPWVRLLTLLAAAGAGYAWGWRCQIGRAHV